VIKIGKELFTIPIIMSVILGLSIQLVSIAESTSNKVVNYAENMESALDCAFLGIDVKECAPELDREHYLELKKELNNTKEIIDKMKEVTYSEVSNKNATYYQLTQEEYDKYLELLKTKNIQEF
jgi:hypothetical protein